LYIDWVEFTPFEIGMAKYATFMDTRYFGSKFFMGILAKTHDEFPLHFLMVGCVSVIVIYTYFFLIILQKKKFLC